VSSKRYARSTALTSALIRDLKQVHQRYPAHRPRNIAIRCDRLAPSSAKFPGNTERRRKVARSRVEHLVAPIKRRLESLMTWQRSSLSARQKPESVLQVGGDTLHTEGTDPAGGQLNCKCNPVQLPANVGNNRASSSISSKVSMLDAARSTNSSTAGNASAPRRSIDRT